MTSRPGETWEVEIVDFLGFTEDSGEWMVVIRRPGCGLCLSTVHPSKLRLIEGLS